MSNLDETRIPVYLSGVGGEPTVADVLQGLKEALEREQREFDRAKTAIKQLQVAIAAIERDEAAAARIRDKQRPVNKRGHVQRAVLQCLRDGNGEVSTIRDELNRQGIETTSGSISNVMQRLHKAQAIRWNRDLGRWAIREDSETSAQSAENEEAHTAGP